MPLQFDLAMRLVQRFRTTGGVLSTGPDYQLARVGVDLMDYLAASVDLATGKQASTWARPSCSAPPSPATGRGIRSSATRNCNGLATNTLAGPGPARC